MEEYNYSKTFNQNYLLKKILLEIINDRFVPVGSKLLLALVCKRWKDFAIVERIDVKTTFHKRLFETKILPRYIKSLILKVTLRTYGDIPKITYIMKQSLKQLHYFRYEYLEAMQRLYIEPEILGSLTPTQLKSFEFVVNSPYFHPELIMYKMVDFCEMLPVDLVSFQFSMLFDVGYQNCLLQMYEMVATRSFQNSISSLKRLGIGQLFRTFKEQDTFWEKLALIEHVDQLYHVPELILNHLTFMFSGALTQNMTYFGVGAECREYIEKFFNQHLSNFQNLVRLDIVNIQLEKDAPFDELFGLYLMSSQIRHLKIRNHLDPDQILLDCICKMRYLEVFKFVHDQNQVKLNGNGWSVGSFVGAPKIQVQFPHEFKSPLRTLKLRGLRQMNILQSRFVTVTPISTKLIYLNIDFEMLLKRNHQCMVHFLQVYTRLERLYIYGIVETKKSLTSEMELNLFFKNVFCNSSLKELIFMSTTMNYSLLDQLFNSYTLNATISNLKVIQFQHSVGLIHYLQNKKQCDWLISDSKSQTFFYAISYMDQQYTSPITQWDYLIRKVIYSFIADKYISIEDKTALRLVCKKWFDFVSIENYIIKSYNQRYNFERYGVPSTVKKMKLKFTQVRQSEISDKMSLAMKNLEEFKFVMSVSPSGGYPIDDLYLKCLNTESLKEFKYYNYSKNTLFNSILFQAERIAREIGRYKIESFQFSSLYTSDIQYYTRLLETLSLSTYPSVLRRINIGHKFSRYSQFISFWNALKNIDNLYQVPEMVVNNINLYESDAEGDLLPVSQTLAEEFFTLHLSKFNNLTRLELADLNSALKHGKVIGKYLIDSKIKELKITNHESTEKELISSICTMKYLEKFILKFKQNMVSKMLNVKLSHPKISFPHSFTSPLKYLKLRGLQQRDILGYEFIIKTPISLDLVHVNIDIDMLYIKVNNCLSSFIKLYPKLEVLKIYGKALNVSNEFDLLFQNVFLHQSLSELVIMVDNINDNLLDQLYHSHSLNSHISKIHVIQLKHSKELINYLKSNYYRYSIIGNKVSLFFN
ncbi:hypothetical protein DLAC_01893 [Tieghemostelium lacteum]|uniref:F-box domain-containing protein n=1 Tax=Tieghemostelium lacteum TaxID=361077 RepID=A0A152A6M1_TIELA|nr:hypothetical protein DLAC_01893 [Tieghemostelium lacteum]|eukprot:KYR01872.1 hypothetical protein DLAC_01893 [Tieghemostelium lacteum]